jgi:hypothetical protein
MLHTGLLRSDAILWQFDDENNTTANLYLFYSLFSVRTMDDFSGDYFLRGKRS